jgi:hypothetical protein
MTIVFRGIALIALLTTTALVTPSFAQTTDQSGGASQSTGGAQSGAQGGGAMQSGGGAPMQAQPGAEGGAGATGGAAAQGGAAAEGGARAAACDQTTSSPACPPAQGERGAGATKPGAMRSKANPNAANSDQVAPSSETTPRNTTSTDNNGGSEPNGARNAAGDQNNTGSSNRTTTTTKENKNTNKNNSTNATSRGSSTTNVNITTEQRTEIRQQIRSINVAPVAHVDFNPSVGVAVPKTVHLRPLPARIVRLVPAYEGFLFFLLPDDRIVVVDPHSLEIVYIID